MESPETGRSKFKRNKKIIDIIVKILTLFPRKFRMKLLNKNKYRNTTFGILIRYCCLKTLVKNLGDNVFIGTNVELKGLENLSIGNNVSIHKDCYIDASRRN